MLNIKSCLLYPYTSSAIAIAYKASSRSLRHEREYSICHSRKYPMLILVCRGLSPHSHPPSHVPIYASLRGISSSSKMPFFTSVSGSGLDWSPFSKLSARM